MIHDSAEQRCVTDRFIARRLRISRVAGSGQRLADPVPLPLDHAEHVGVIIGPRLVAGIGREPVPALIGH
jgi:hypothetical protein